MNPVSEIKSKITPGKIFAFLITGLAVLALADAFKLTNWFIYPISSAKAWYEARKAKA